MFQFCFLSDDAEKRVSNMVEKIKSVIKEQFDYSKELQDAIDYAMSTNSN